MSPIERSGGGGGGSGSFSLIFDSTLGAPATSIDTGAGGVPGTFSALKILLLGRTSNVVFNDTAALVFNNDTTAAHYDAVWTRNNGGVIGSVDATAQPNAQLGVVPGASGTANYFAATDITIPAYTQTTAFKTGVSNSGVTYDALAHATTIFVTFSWRSTAAITRIAFVLQTGSNLIAGSRMTIYGMQ